MEQRRFCARCNAPAVKGASFCVVCGGSDFVLPQVEEPVKPVEIDDAVVSIPVESKFIKPDIGNGFNVTINESSEDYVTQAPVVQPQPVAQPKPVVQPQPIVQSQPVAQPEPQPRTNVMSNEGRTVAYKSFEEYEREVAQSEAPATDKGKKSKGAKVALVILSIFLSLLIAVCTFVLGVFLTYEGYLDEYLPKSEEETEDKYYEEMEECYDLRQDLAHTVAEYISDNGIYVDKTTTIIIESTDDGERCLIDVNGECLTASECADLLEDDYICPGEGTYEIEIIPYVDSDGKSMFKIEVSCDGGENDYLHK